jgi:hypothetical protein
LEILLAKKVNRSNSLEIEIEKKLALICLVVSCFF